MPASAAREAGLPPRSKAYPFTFVASISAWRKKTNRLS